LNSKRAPIHRFAIRGLAFLWLQSVIAAIVIGYGSTRNSNDYLMAIQDKLQRLDQCQGPRVVLLGGSNVAFGMHSPVIRESMGMETVNLGLHASLGLAFPLECYRQHARRGDIVILSPEYHLLTSDSHRQGDAITMDQLLEQWPESRRYMTQSAEQTWKTFLDREALWTAHQWVGRAFRTLRGKDSENKIYSRSGFNQHGDLVAHYGRSDVGLMPLSDVPPSTPQSLENTIRVLNDFHASCRDRGVDVYFCYPPLLESIYQSSEPAILQLHRTLQAGITLPVLGHPRDSSLPRDCFFDGGYHLTESSGRARSKTIAARVKQRHESKQSTAVATRKLDGDRPSLD
jgi:hypothetical protein